MFLISKSKILVMWPGQKFWSLQFLPKNPLISETVKKPGHLGWTSLIYILITSIYEKAKFFGAIIADNMVGLTGGRNYKTNTKKEKLLLSSRFLLSQLLFFTMWSYAIFLIMCDVTRMCTNLHLFDFWEVPWVHYRLLSHNIIMNPRWYRGFRLTPCYVWRPYEVRLRPVIRQS